MRVEHNGISFVIMSLFDIIGYFKLEFSGKIKIMILVFKGFLTMKLSVYLNNRTLRLLNSMRSPIMLLERIKHRTKKIS